MRLGVRVCLSPIANGGSGPGTGMVTGGPMVALGNGMVPGDPWGQAPGHHIETVMDFARLLKRFCALPPARIICIKLHYNMMQSYLKLVRQEKSTVFRIGDEIINNRASLGCLWNSIQAWLVASDVGEYTHSFRLGRPMVFSLSNGLGQVGLFSSSIQRRAVVSWSALSCHSASALAHGATALQLNCRKSRR